MSGPAAEPKQVQAWLGGYAPTIGVGTVLFSHVAPSNGRVCVIRARAQQAGTAGNTVLDLFRNGTSMYRNQTRRPTLVGTTVGAFSANAPDEQAIVAGDLIQLLVQASGGHQGVSATAAVEQP
jgi:hypothetical protein